MILLLIFLDRRVIDNDRLVELSIYDNLKDSTENVIQHPERYEEHQNDFKREIEKIKQLPEKYNSEKKFLSYLYIIILFTFVGGILSLIGAWTAKPIVDVFYLNNFVSIGLIILLSLILGFIKFGTLESEGWNWQNKFAEFWNDSLNFIIAGLVGYYFILLRWPRLLEGESLQISDFALFIIFVLGIFGHLCVLSKNITDGITAILKRVLEGK